ncbi:MAG: hypothetical protein O3C43_19655 [Verrucomicrobia bacterium]|nr:hypothetical protein [Verrucomicrobiota bacterium]MDA1068708.1 hypothetical protein [Verrucomicrobiota bacterium]
MYSLKSAHKWFVFLTLLSSTALYGGDPIPGIDITVEQSSSGITKQGKTNAQGELILSGFQEGKIALTVNHKGKISVLGNRPNDAILLQEKYELTVKPIRMELARYISNERTGKGNPLRGSTRAGNEPGTLKGTPRRGSTRTGNETITGDLTVNGDENSTGNATSTLYHL